VQIFGRKRSKWQGVDFMELIPAHSLDAETDPESGQTTLMMPRFTGVLWGRLIQPRLGPKKRFIRVPLDQRGQFLWHEMDGQRPIRDLIAAFADRFPSEVDDVPRRISSYLYSMAENKFIHFVNLDEQVNR